MPDDSAEPNAISDAPAAIAAVPLRLLRDSLNTSIPKPSASSISPSEIAVDANGSKRAAKTCEASAPSIPATQSVKACVAPDNDCITASFIDLLICSVMAFNLSASANA